MVKRIFLIFLLFLAVAAGVYIGLRIVQPRLESTLQSEPVKVATETSRDTWEEAVAKVKADRDPAENSTRLETPPELKHYEERHWFLATQVAEIAKYGVHTCQDYMDLAGMIERGEIVTVPAFTDTYILFGIGQRADDEAFSRYADERSIEIYNESQLTEAYKRLDEKRSKLEGDIASLKSQATKLTKRDEPGAPNSKSRSPPHKQNWIQLPKTKQNSKNCTATAKAASECFTTTNHSSRWQRISRDARST